jgi:hypothetical protein
VSAKRTTVRTSATDMLGACRNPGLSQPPPPAIKSAAKENIASPDRYEPGAGVSWRSLNHRCVRLPWDSGQFAPGKQIAVDCFQMGTHRNRCCLGVAPQQSGDQCAVLLAVRVSAFGAE